MRLSRIARAPAAGRCAVAGPFAVVGRPTAGDAGTAAAWGEVSRARRPWPTVCGHRPGPDGGGVGGAGAGLKQGGSARYLYEVGDGNAGPGELMPGVGSGVAVLVGSGVAVLVGVGVAVLVGVGVPGQSGSAAQGAVGPGSSLGAKLGPYSSSVPLSTEGEGTGGTSGSPLLTRREPPAPGLSDEPASPRGRPPDAEATGRASASPLPARREPPGAVPSDDTRCPRSSPLGAEE